MGAFVDITGEFFGRLQALHRLSKVKHGQSVRWVCLCECGQRTEVTSDNLRSGSVQSCGCLQKMHARRIGKQLARHGHARPTAHSITYSTWTGMCTRVRNPNATGYDRYGGRGITMDPRWETFENFLADMGPRPSKSLSLDRRDPDGPYDKANCRWATRKEQACNRSKNCRSHV